ncbi:MAG: hypothetical protein II130_07855, partial [Bacteroidales bacterium]|nr:hypothetical protein [Bacteroidales bacterium]
LTAPINPPGYFRKYYSTLLSFKQMADLIAGKSFYHICIHSGQRIFSDHPEIPLILAEKQYLRYSIVRLKNTMIYFREEL